MSGRARRTSLRTRPGRSAVVGVLGLAAAVAVPVTAVVGVRTIADSKTGEIAVTVPGETVTVLPDTPGGLLVEHDDEGALVGVTVFAVNRGGAGGTAVVVPTSTVITGADGTVRRITDVYAEGGLTAAQTAVETLLGVSFTAADDVDHDRLTELLAPYAPLTVEFNDRVVDTVDGDDETLVDQASRDLTASDAARVLLARKDGESEIARLPRVVAVWEAVLGESAVLEDATTPDTGDPSADTTVEGGASTTAVPSDAAIDGYVAAVASGPHEVQALTVALCPDGGNGERFDVESTPFVRLLMAQVLPGAVSTASGARVRVLQPRPDQPALLSATARLNALGMNLVLATSGGAAAVPARTKVEYHSPEDQAAAEQLAASGQFGPVEVVPSSEPVRTVNLTVTLGADFEALAEAEAQAGPPTTVEPCTPTTIPATQETG